MGESSEPTISNIVLTVTVDGGIVGAAHSNGDPGASGSLNLDIRSIYDLWPELFADAVRGNVRKAVRNRGTHSAEYAANDGQFECIYAAHGRDRALVVVRDISERKAEVTRIQKMAYIDSVTGLPNRDYLLEQLANITDTKRLKEGRAALISLEIEQNELQSGGMGVAFQEMVLKEISSRLIGGLRGANQPEQKDEQRYSIAARTDFSQFGIVLPSIENGTDAEAVAKRVTDLIKKPLAIEQREINVEVYAGIALFPQDGDNATTLFASAHSAMEDAKSGASAEYKFHSGTVRVRALQRQDLALELRVALDREEFDLHYLGVVAASTGKFTAAEALLRWPDALSGARSISKVIELAERTGLMVPIGDWILRTSCKQLTVWHQAGHRDLRLSVNLSAQEFSRDRIAARVATILEDTGLDPAYLDLEITEQLLFRDALKDFPTCRDLKSLGVGIVVDDYGTGACSLASLAKSPIDAVKIDNSLVANSVANPSDRAACAAVLAMAHELGMIVIAEGVESQEQAEQLIAQGCDCLQGYLYNMPASAEEFEKLLGADLTD